MFKKVLTAINNDRKGSLVKGLVVLGTAVGGVVLAAIIKGGAKLDDIDEAILLEEAEETEDAA